MSPAEKSPDPSPMRPRGQRGWAGTLFSLLRRTGVAWVDDNAMRLSAALSLYAILSLAPLLVIAIKIVGIFWGRQAYASEQIGRQMTGLMGTQAAQALAPMIASAGRQGQGTWATVISTAVLLFSATGVFVELQDAMNTIWCVKPRPHWTAREFLRNRLLTLAMVFGIGLLLLLSIIVSAVLTAAATYLAGRHRWVVLTVEAVVSFAMVAVLFAAIFKFLPDTKLAWGNVWVGAVAAAGGFAVGKYGLVLYFKYAAPTSAFGAAGSLVAVLLWVYYSSFIFFFGAELAKVWSREHRETKIA